MPFDSRIRGRSALAALLAIASVAGCATSRGSTGTGNESAKPTDPPAGTVYYKGRTIVFDETADPPRGCRRSKSAPGDGDHHDRFKGNTRDSRADSRDAERPPCGDHPPSPSGPPKSSRGSRVPRAAYPSIPGPFRAPRNAASDRSRQLDTVTIGSSVARATSPSDLVDRMREGHSS